MNLDFTREKYRQLLTQLKDSGYEFVTFADYCGGNHPLRFVILRHDVDLKPQNSLKVAKDEKELGAKAAYYFRVVPESWDDEIIKAVHQMGHEVGYHYESLTTCHGNMEDAFEDFKHNLVALRKLVPVQTICMHGSPQSPYDSKDIWKTYSYHDLGIIGEPYFDTDFSQMLYLTDTGRCWDGYKESVRDKIEGYQEEWNAKGWSFHSTDDIIKALQENRLPDRIMITTHPQRWNDEIMSWGKELILQNMKNIVKRLLVKTRNWEFH